MKLAFACVLALAGCGNGPQSGETCTQAVCPAGGHTYRFCSQGGKCRYLSSDGTIFPCLSCGECSAGAAGVAAWCNSNVMGGTTGTGTTGTSTTSGTTTGGTTGAKTTTIGKSCVISSDCTDGTNPTCRRSASSSTGMCSADCSRDADCGNGNVCVFGSSPPGACARACSAASDCGNGLGCWIVLDHQACWPLDGVFEFGQPLTLNCDPTVPHCNGAGGCSRQVLGPGFAGVCRQGCDIGTSQCPSLNYSSMIFQQSCYFVDESIDMMNQPTGDALKQPICVIDVPVGSPSKFIADGAECLDPNSGQHYFDICQPGSQCEVYTLAVGAAPDNKCHKLCYLGSLMLRDLGAPDGGAALTCPVGQSCTDVFGTAGSSLPVGLCK
jgi:hypothetical protein